MPKPITDQSVKIVWENNPDTPITAASLSKDVFIQSSYKDFEFQTPPGPHLEDTIFTVDTVGIAFGEEGYDPPWTDAYMQLIMKRQTIIQIINEARDGGPPPPGDYIIPKDDQYRLFDNGLEDLYINIHNMDENPDNEWVDNPYDPPRNWGDLREWYIFLCDKDDTSTEMGVGETYGGGAQIWVGLKRGVPPNIELWPYGMEVPGRTGGPSEFYTAGDSRLIGGFKSDTLGKIIPESIWDILTKVHTMKARQYFILDEFAIDDDDTALIKRHLYRPLRVADLDTSSTDHNNIFENDVTITGNVTQSGGDLELALDASDRVGIGTSSFDSWNSNYKIVQIGDRTSIVDGSNYTKLGNNYYEAASGHKHTATGYNSYYQQYNGKHMFISGNTNPGAGGVMDRIFTMTLTKDGNVGIGSTTPDPYTLHVTGEVDGISLVLFEPEWLAVTSNDTVYKKGLAVQEGNLPISSGSTDSGYRIGIEVDLYANDVDFEGTLATQRAGWFRAGTSSVDPTGTITNSYAVFTETLYGTNSTIDNAYGVYITGVASGPTNYWGLYQNISTAKNYFAGDVGVGIDDPSTKLHVKHTDNVEFRLEATPINKVSAIRLMSGSQQWGVQCTASDNFIISDYSNSKFPFQISSNAPTNSINVDVSGNLSIVGNFTLGGNTIQISGAGSLNTGSSPSGSLPLEYNGYFYATRVYGAVYNDLAEYFLSNEAGRPGSVYVACGNKTIMLSRKRADRAVVGVCSDSAAYVMKDEYRDKGVLIGLSGTVEVKVMGKIEYGQELVSYKHGVATKANIFEKIFKRGSIIGKSLESKYSGDINKILMLIK